MSTIAKVAEIPYIRLVKFPILEEIVPANALSETSSCLRSTASIVSTAVLKVNLRMLQMPYARLTRVPTSVGMVPPSALELSSKSLPRSSRALVHISVSSDHTWSHDDGDEHQQHYKPRP